MKSALLVSYRVDLLKVIADVLGTLSTDVSEAEGYVRMVDGEGRILTVFGMPQEETLRSLREDENTLRGGVTAPDLGRLCGCSIECRWEDLFASVVREVARAAGETCWVVDGDGVIWDAAHVDPNLVRL